MGHWLSEPELTPYVASTTLPQRRLLVLAPHPDDEILGCGGLMAAMLADGAAVQVIVVSDGALGGDPAQREQESRQAALTLAAGLTQGPQLAFWRLPDRALASQAALAARLGQAIAHWRAEVVLLPSPFEVHPDHRALCLAGLDALRGAGDQAQGLFYEVGQPLLPDLLIDISAQVARKQAALRCFVSQLAVQAYDEQLLGLNRFRAYTLGPSVSHAEAFWRVDAVSLRMGSPALLARLTDGLARRFQGLSADLA